MNKNLLLFIIPFFVFISPIFAHAEGIETWKSEIKQIKEERNKLRSEYKQAQEKEKVKIDMKEQKLIRYLAAYEKAIEYLNKGETVTYSNDSIIRFKPIYLLPGEQVPKEYIPIYKEAGERFNVHWSILAAIHKIETDYSRIEIMRSYMGAVGHMQFLPSTFKAYAIDGDGDGLKSVWSLKDSIFSAANYLNKSGYSKDQRKAIWHYNHAEWYVNKVINTATKIRNSTI